MDNNMISQDHEILMELLAEKRQRDVIRRIKMIVALVILAAVIVMRFTVVPKVVAVIRQYNRVVNELEQAFTKVDGLVLKYGSTFEKLATIDVESIQTRLGKVNEFVDLFSGIASIFGR